VHEEVAEVVIELSDVREHAHARMVRSGGERVQAVCGDNQGCMRLVMMGVPDEATDDCGHEQVRCPTCYVAAMVERDRYRDPPRWPPTRLVFLLDRVRRAGDARRMRPVRAHGGRDLLDMPFAKSRPMESCETGECPECGAPVLMYLKRPQQRQ